MRPVPAFLHEKLEAQYGPTLAARIEAGYRAERATTLRVNTLKATRDNVRERLSEAGLRLEAVSWYPDALVVTGLDETRARRWMEQQGHAASGPGGRDAGTERERSAARTNAATQKRIGTVSAPAAQSGSGSPVVPGAAPDGSPAPAAEADPGARTAAPRRLRAADVLRAHPLYAEGAIYLQNLSAMIPALAVAPQAGQAVLDMCAAPGGKTCQLAALSENAALITACEKNPLRAERLRYNLEKQGARRVNVMVTDARKLDPLFTFDAVLLDAPCSGSGTVQLADERQAKKQRFSSDLLARTVRTQRALLARALEAVPAGGIVTYSTCSVLADENEEVVKAALEGALYAHAAEKAGDAHDPRNKRRDKNGTRGKGKRARGRKGGGFPAAARYGAWDDGWDADDGAADRHAPLRTAGIQRDAALSACPDSERNRNARRSPACELVPLDPEHFAGVPLLPVTLDGTLCVRPTDRYEGFFVAQLKKL